MTFARYNYYHLHENGYEVLELDASQLPEIRINKYNLARSDGEKVTNVNYGRKPVKLKGRIKASDRNDMDNKLDTLKTYLVGIDKPLDIFVGGTLRRYNATVDSFTTEINGYSCFYEITFTCDAFGEAIDATSLTFSSPVTTASTTHSNTIGGTYKVRPSFDITMTHCKPYWDTRYLDISNSVLGKRMRINRQWGFGDRLVIDGENKEVSIYPSTVTVIDDCDSITGWTSTHTLSLGTTQENIISGSGYLYVTMAAGATATSVSRLNATAVDLSSTAGKLLIPIYIHTTSPTVAITKVTVTMGSDATLASNYVTYDVTTQPQGDSLAEAAMNIIVVDLSTAATSTVGSPTRTAIKSIKIEIVPASSTDIAYYYIDYITLHKASIISESQDYEGTFVEYEPGAATIALADEFEQRSYTVSGNYKKRYL